MTRAKPVVACAVLALAAHAALLLRAGGMAGHDAPSSKAMSVRLQMVEVQATTTQAAEEPTAHAEPAPAPSVEPGSAASPSPTNTVESPPSFDGDPPAIGFPDAPLPGEGAELRAYLMLDERGAMQSVSISAPPGLPAGFQKLAELGLRQAQLKPSNTGAYCLLVRFEPGALAARLSWLPGLSRDAARCLTGPMTAPRDIEAP